MPRRRIAIDPGRRAYSDTEVLELNINRLRDSMYRDPVALDEWDFKQAYYHGPGNYEFIDKEWRKIRIGETWGGEDITAFFRKTAVVPEAHHGKPLFLDIYFNGDSLLKVNGVPHQGLDHYRRVIFLTERAVKGTRYEFEVEGHVKHLPYEKWRHETGNVRTFEQARFVVVDREVEKLYYDARTAFDACLAVSDNRELQEFLFEELRTGLNMIDYYETDFEKFKSQVSQAEAYIQDKIYKCDKFKLTGKLSLAGQSHLDIVYLWPYKETIRKNARTTSSMLNLMEEYPEFRFTQSQPKLYEDLAEYYPQLFERVKQRQKEGRWECTGGMYIEPDCNLISGESFVRQILHGKRYFRKTFGFDATVCWLPDVFGNMWSMPQILLKAGVKYLSSIKLTTWNDHNDFPHNTFWWRGIDGSRLLTHFPPTHFNACFAPQVAKMHWDKYGQKIECGESLIMYGKADGGSGVTREMLEYARRLKSFPGMPSCEIHNVEDYFDRISKKVKNLPEWYDELYLEGHRGTYTTAGLLKKRNRQCEMLYREAEIFGSFANLLGHPYPRDTYNQGWRIVLLHQFHDTLPGTHPKPAFEWAAEEYKKAVEIGQGLKQSALSFLASKIKTAGDSLIVFNSLPWNRTDIVRCLVATGGKPFRVLNQQGNEISYQIVSQKGSDVEIIFTASDVSSLGYATFGLKFGETPAKAEASLAASPQRIENKFFFLEFDSDGHLKTIFDKVSQRNILAPNSIGNQFQLFEDIPGQFSAWDIIPTYKDKEWEIKRLESIEVAESGPVRASVRLRRKFLSSEIRQTIVLYSELPRIDFETEVSWWEKEKLLKVRFPVDIISKSATYDIPFGNIERPTHKNTSWEEAKYEVCGHKWVDLAEGDYGVSFLNDCKYGYDIHDNVMRITLLKAPVFPNPEADRGEHSFTYSMYPHAGTWRTAQVARRAYELNSLLTAAQQKAQSGELPTSLSFASVNRENVFLEAVKLAEDSDEYIVRVFENYRQRGNVTLSFFRDIAQVTECNLMEENDSPIEFSKNMITFYTKPYEIRTFKVRFKA